jgi:hypothetical protein
VNPTEIRLGIRVATLVLDAIFQYDIEYSFCTISYNLETAAIAVLMSTVACAGTDEVIKREQTYTINDQM